MAEPVALDREIEAATQQIGRELWNRLQHRQPNIFNTRWWLDHVLEWAMEDESVKVQMFRFVDVLPMLKTHDQVTRHLEEYFDEVRSHLPWAVRLGLSVSQPNTLLGKALAITARANARKMGERFIAGEKVDEVLKSVTKLRRQGFAFTLDLLGEAVISEPEAEHYQQQYLNLIEGLAPVVNSWHEDAHLDRDNEGWIPRVNVSLKLSALFSRFRPIDPKGTAEGVKPRLRPILRAARENDAYVHIDMEHYAYKDLTLEIFKQVFMEDEFRDYPDCGIVIQAYLPEASRDLEDLLKWTKKRGTPIWVRLVKGAYWDYETVSAKSHGWPVPVYQHKWQSDENFEKQTRFLMENHQWLRPAIASHNLRSLAHSIAWAERLNLPPSAWEIQMLYGMADEPGPVVDRVRPPSADLHAVRRSDPRHGISRPSAAREYVERFLSADTVTTVAFVLRISSCPLQKPLNNSIQRPKRNGLDSLTSPFPTSRRVTFERKCRRRSKRSKASSARSIHW